MITDNHIWFLFFSYNFWLWNTSQRTFSVIHGTLKRNLFSHDNYMSRSSPFHKYKLCNTRNLTHESSSLSSAISFSQSSVIYSQTWSEISTESSRNNQLINFKFFAILSSKVKVFTILLSSAQDVTHLFNV